MTLTLTSCERVSEPDTRLPHEIHNSIAFACAAAVIVKVPDLEGRLTALESIVVGVIGLCRLQPEGKQLALDLIRDGAGDRLNVPAYGEPI